MSLLEIKNLSKSYDTKKVINNLSLSLDANQIVTILGKSGEGKTTILKVLNQLEDFQEGRIIINGKMLHQSKKEDQLIQKEVGMVFQDYNLFPHLTVLENLNLAQIKVLKRTKEEASRVSLEYLNKVGIIDKANSYPISLSGGETQRVAIARALVMSPKILCFDEPTSALDPLMRQEVAKLIKGLKDEKTLFLVVTHDIAFAKDISDKIIFFKDGDVLEEGSVKELQMSKNQVILDFMNE